MFAVCIISQMAIIFDIVSPYSHLFKIHFLFFLSNMYIIKQNLFEKVWFIDTKAFYTVIYYSSTSVSIQSRLLPHLFHLYNKAKSVWESVVHWYEGILYSNILFINFSLIQSPLYEYSFNTKTSTSHLFQF